MGLANKSGSYIKLNGQQKVKSLIIVDWIFWVVHELQLSNITEIAVKFHLSVTFIENLLSKLIKQNDANIYCRRWQPPSIPSDIKCWNRYFELKQLCLTMVLIIRFVHVRWTLSEFGFLIFKRKLDSRYQNIWHSDFKLGLFNLKRYHKTKISQGYIQRSAFGHLILNNFN